MSQTQHNCQPKVHNTVYSLPKSPQHNVIRLQGNAHRPPTGAHSNKAIGIAHLDPDQSHFTTSLQCIDCQRASTAASCFATFYYLGCTQHDTRASHLTSTSIAVLLMMAKQRITPIRTKRSRTKRRLSPWTPSMASQDSLCKSWPLPSDCAPGTTYITVAMRKTRNKLWLRHVASVSRINIEIGGRVRWDRAVKYKYTIILPIRNRRQKLSSVYLPCCNVLTASTSWQVEQRLRCKC
jgi:hypothetical protein